METLVERVKRHEGCVLTTYMDSLGHESIGYGHKLTRLESYPNGITEDEAMDILITDLDIAKSQVATAFPWSLRLDDVRLSVLIEMVFQLGIGGVQKFQKMLNAMREDDYDRAALEMLDSQWHVQTPSRCEELARIMRTGG